MSFSLQMIASAWLWPTWGLYIVLLLLALWQADWPRLRNPSDANIWFASCVLLWLTWRLVGGVAIHPGLEFHILMVTSVTLMFGWPFAIIAVSIAQAVLTLEGQAEWGAYALNTLCNGIVPVFTTFLLYRFIDRFLPRHFFVYIFLGAFLGGALSMVFSRLLGMLVLLSSGAYELTDLSRDYIFLLPVMLFPEAFLNGMVMTILVVFRPEWVSSFSDERYLKGK